MSYNILRVNDSEPVNNNIDFNLTDCLDQLPVGGEVLIYNGGQWTTSTIGGEPPIDLENQVSIVHTGSNTYTSYSVYRATDRWAMPWHKTLMTHDLNTGSSLASAYRPPSTITNTAHAHAVLLPPGKFLIRATASIYSSAADHRLFTSSTSNGSGTPLYHGNEVRISYDLSKPGGMMCALVNFTSARYLFIRNVTYTGASPLYLGLHHVTIQVRKINE